MTTKTAFIFPGQASQYVGMGRALAETATEAAQIFAQADQILETPFAELCWSGPEEKLNDTYNTQPAVFITSIAVWTTLQVAGYTRPPDFVAGHSLGEYSAYVVSGVLSFEDGLKLVRKRSYLMQKAGQQKPGKMAAIVRLDLNKLEAICEKVTQETGSVELANYNSPEQVVISGDESGVDQAIQLAKEAGVRRAIKLGVSVAPHSKLMEVVYDEFATAVDETRLEVPQIPIVANITAKPLLTIDDIRTEMREQLTSPVRWMQSIQYMISQKVDQFIELGPKSVLTNLQRRIDKQVTARAIETSEQINDFLQAQSL